MVTRESSLWYGKPHSCSTWLELRQGCGHQEGLSLCGPQLLPQRLPSGEDGVTTATSGGVELT